jgi:outer membrane protein
MLRTLLCTALLYGCTGVMPGQTVVRLSLKQALELATSPGASSAQIAELSVRTATSRYTEARSLLLPAVTASVAEQSQIRNIAAEGVQFSTPIPGYELPVSVGPFRTTDARVFITQNIFNASMRRRAKGAHVGIDTARADIAVTRENVALGTALDYLSALRAQAEADAARTAVKVSETLLQVAEDREAVGKAAAVEVTRARLRLSADRRRLSVSQNSLDQASYQLLDDVGLDLDAPLELTDKLTFFDEQAADFARDLADALASRPELQSNRTRAEQARINDNAIRLDRMPSVSAYADVGALSSVLTYSVGLSVRLEVFDGGRREAERAASAAVLRQHEIEGRDLKRKIEVEIRRALTSLASIARQVHDSSETVTLAEEELAQARRRFDAGVTGNVELVEAQAQVAQAVDDRISLLFQWNQARLKLFQAKGKVRDFEIARPGN